MEPDVLIAPAGATGLELQMLNPLTDPSWDDRLRAHPDCCFFQSAAWARVLRDSYGETPVFLTRQKSGSICALLPAVEIKSWLTGRRGVSMAFADFCPPLAPDSESYAELLQAMIAEGESRGWRSLECRGGFELLEGIPSSMCFYGHTLDLSVGEESLFESFEGRVRNAVRKAEASGIKVEISRQSMALEQFYQLHCRTRRKHGLPPQPLRFFRSVHDQVLERGNGVVALARLQGEAVAAAVFFHLGRQAIYKYSASNLGTQHLRPNNLLLWEAIRWYARAGFLELHFGRTSASNEGLRLFKRGFGTQEHQIQYFKYDFRQRSFRSGSEGLPGWPNRLCRFLPLPALRLVGRALYRHVA